MQPAGEFSNSCGSRCAGCGDAPGKTESCSLDKLRDSSVTSLIKRNLRHPTSAVLQSNAFRFSFPLAPQNKTAQTDRNKKKKKILSMFECNRTNRPPWPRILTIDLVEPVKSSTGVTQLKKTFIFMFLFLSMYFYAKCVYVKEIRASTFIYILSFCMLGFSC